MSVVDFTVQQIACRRAAALPDALASTRELVVLKVLYGRVSIRATCSTWPPSGDDCPFEGQLRMGFGSLRESASQFQGSEWDTLSGTRPFGKLHPGIGAQSGTQLPLEARCGKCVPESRSKTGHSFRERALGESASHTEPEFWDTVSAQTEEGALPALIAGSAPFALSFVEA